MQPRLFIYWLRSACPERGEVEGFIRNIETLYIGPLRALEEPTVTSQFGRLMRLVAKWCFGWLGMLVFAVAIYGCGRTVDNITGTVGGIADWVWSSLHGEPRGDRALVIGIGRYLTPDNNLPGSVNDAHIVRDLLSKHLGFESNQIRVLTDEQATRRAILGGIRDWLVAGTRPGARALLYYSGHGSYLSDDNGDEYDGTDEALVPHDERYIRDDEIRTLFTELRGRQAYLIIDSWPLGYHPSRGRGAKYGT